MSMPLPSWIQKQLPEGTASQFFDSSLGKIHYLTRGRGRQVVMIHGNPTWSFLWRRVMAELQPQEFEVLAPDLMNLGFSDDLPNDRFNIESHVTYLSEFFKARARPGAILVAQDWGGPIGLLAAERCPGLFSGFVILNTGVAAPRFPAKLSWFHRLSHTPIVAEFIFGVLGFPLSALHKVQFDKNSIQGDIARAYSFPIGWSRRLSALRYARMVPSSEAHSSQAWFHRLESYSKTLKDVEVVWGVRDPILGRQLGRVRQVLSGAKITEVEAGHFLQEEAFKAIADAVKRASLKN